MRNRQIFINCPFTRDHELKFRAIVFTVIRCGYKPRCALEADDGSEVRFDKICNIIGQCRLGIHDISKTEPDADSGLPRFNMPLELGLFLAAKRFGGPSQRNKKCIVFDAVAYRYQKFISDIAGQDLHSHSGNVDQLIVKTAAWLRDDAPSYSVPGGKAISTEFSQFCTELPVYCARTKIDLEELTFVDFSIAAANWIKAMAGA